MLLLTSQEIQVFKGEEYSEKADVFSFGMIIWFLFSGLQPDAGNWRNPQFFRCVVTKNTNN